MFDSLFTLCCRETRRAGDRLGRHAGTSARRHAGAVIHAPMPRRARVTERAWCADRPPAAADDLVISELAGNLPPPASSGGGTGVLAAVVAACVVGFGWGCESTPDRAAEADASARSEAASAEGGGAGGAEVADDPLADEFEAFAQRVEEAAEARSRPANDGEIEWLEAGRLDPDVTAADRPAAAVPNIEQPLRVPDAGEAASVAADDSEPEVEQQPDEGAADQPSPPPAAAGLDVDGLGTQQLVEALADRLSAGRRDSLRPWLAEAALSLADPRRELTDRDLGMLATEDRQLVLAYQRMFTQLGRSLGRDAEADRAELALAAEELLEQLAAERHLSIRTAKLCTRVNGYGIYDEFESTRFVAGRERPAIVYIELDDYETERDGDGQHVVRLRQEIVLYNASDGLAVWRVNPTEIVDRSRNQRRDFFLVQVVRLPATLNVGRYLLKVTITDEVGQAVDEKTIPIEFVADTNAAR